MGRRTDIATACRAAGLTVIETAGWRDRGSATFDPQVVVIHHTGGAATGNMPSLPVLINGRADLPGPLCQVGLGRDGTVFVVAAGRANHAGAGGWHGITGNTHAWGIEAENTGAQPWPPKQIDAYVRLAAVLCQLAGIGADRVCGHREWATPPGRKVDPTGIDLTDFRARVASVLAHETPDVHQEDDMTYIFTPDSRVVLLHAGRLVWIAQLPLDPEINTWDLRNDQTTWDRLLTAYGPVIV